MGNVMDKITSLAKRRGFIFQSSEIYGGIQGFWDYGPLGTQLKQNIKKEWWHSMVKFRDDVVGIDASIIMNPTVWEKSGHLKEFTDPLVECRVCNQRFRADKKEELKAHEEFEKIKPKDSGLFTEPKKFNLMMEALLGVTEPKTTTYLRGEITQGAFVNFENVVSSTRVKIPFGIAQVGKAFRNEITPGNFTYRSREFEQMELEYFVHEKEADKWFKYWKEERIKWYESLGLNKKNLRFRVHEPNERAHYAKAAEDIEYNAPFGWSEFEGIHNRGDYDLSAHGLKYKTEGEEFTPWVIETSGGVDRSTLFFLIDAYHEEKDRVVLKLHPKLAPYKVAVFPLLANKPELVSKAKEIYDALKIEHHTAWDDRGNIGKRYFAQDEAGTPFCITVDFDTLEDDTVTVRDRDTTKQERISTGKLLDYLDNKISH
jgi:glycyl-tRNA synthetase